MRFGYRKKIGNFYVGGSVSSKELGSGCLSLFMFPFYLVFWPFVAFFRGISKNSGKKSAPSKTKTNSEPIIRTVRLQPVPLRGWYIALGAIWSISGLIMLTDDFAIGLLTLLPGALMLAFTYLSLKANRMTELPAKPQTDFQLQQQPLSQPSYSQSQLNRQLQIFDDSLKLIMQTNNPQTFFGRYDDAQRSAQAMAAMTSDAVVHGASPQEVVSMLQDQKAETTNLFLDRYAKETRLKAFELTRGRKAKIEVFQLMTSEYDEQMPPESREYRDKLYAEMLEKLESIES